MAGTKVNARAGVGTLVGFLLGRRDAILAMAASRHALWIGALFVLSAAIAREYDQEFILRRPWILLVPLAASLVSSFLLWILLWCSMLRRHRFPIPFWGNYRRFLGLFWMTAPLAWLYAIPYERFLAPVDAVFANYATLGLVAAWRVYLMIRVARVWCGRTAFGSAALVLFFGDVVLFAALILSPWPVIDMMSGNNDPVAMAEHNLLFWITALSFLVLPVTALAALARVLSRRVPPPPTEVQLPPPMLPAQSSFWSLAVGACIVGLLALPFAQYEIRDKPTPEERRRQMIDERQREREEQWRKDREDSERRDRERTQRNSSD